MPLGTGGRPALGINPRPAPSSSAAAPARAAAPALALSGASPLRMGPPAEPPFGGLNPRPLPRPYGGATSFMAWGHIGMQVCFPVLGTTL